MEIQKNLTSGPHQSAGGATAESSARTSSWTPWTQEHVDEPKRTLLSSLDMVS